MNNVLECARYFDVVVVGEQHDEALDADAPAGSGRQAVVERVEERFVDRHRLGVAGRLGARLLLEQAPLHRRVVQLRVRIAELQCTAHTLPE